jgi:hypothetical protein
MSSRGRTQARTPNPSPRTPDPAFNSLDTCPRVTLARQAPDRRIRTRRKGGMRQGWETSQQTRCSPAWERGKIAALKGQPVKLRFTLRETALCSFWIDQ